MGMSIGGYFGRPMIVEVVKAELVTENNLGEILGVTAFEQHALIDLGDVISVIFFHNGSVDRSGTITIWHNKEEATIKTPFTSLTGEWLEDEQVVVSEEIEESWTLHGELVSGRMAMDITGVPGIYSCGTFFSLQRGTVH
ncbi:hypothetical protein [Geomesophilobacter sediminis]|uniref:Uncharacterized protein n=1 Tax=Geomesophilobacter sediminis TaxID=2798584 RepID=A0A8J7IX12_9BACT|nr:hypothetical protein [Geomesophilobacter sediminis]MBJ6724277.1 hypothetical protein [Geomesophilobacter sediminis]